jgi:diacylglycerol kinase (ATP)
VKLGAIINPKAGSVKDVELVEKNIQELKPAYVRVTADVGDAKNYAAEAVRHGCECIVAAGGDGTLNEVINGIARDASRARNRERFRALPESAAQRRREHDDSGQK